MEWIYELIRISIYVSIGFVLGAAWCGLCKINNQVDKPTPDPSPDL